MPANRPLAMTADPDLLDDLLRLAAAGGVELDVAAEPTGARRWYAPAPLVLVGADLVDPFRRAGLPRRPRVVLVGRSGEGEPPWEAAESLGAEHLALLPAAEPWLVDRFIDLTTTATEPGRVLAVIGGRGGAGASVLAAGIATTAARSGFRTLLVDGDPLGGGIDLVLGWESVNGIRWSGLREATGRVRPPALVEALPSQGLFAVLSWDRGECVAVPTAAMEAAVDAGRSSRDLVVIDLPRRLDAAAVVALRAADKALLVVPAELRATAAAARVAAAVSPHCPSLSLVVRGPTPGRLSAKEVAKSLRLPLTGCLRPEPRLAAALERGEIPARTGRGPLAALCRRIVAELMGPAREAAAA